MKIFRLKREFNSPLSIVNFQLSIKKMLAVMVTILLLMPFTALAENSTI